MATKNGTKVLTEILNIEGIKVISQSQQPGIGIMLQVDSISKESHFASAELRSPVDPIWERLRSSGLGNPKQDEVFYRRRRLQWRGC